ncbi:hypothetical protein vBAmePR8F_gp02 [Alteromonas phage vB_AmeP_R8W]|uniref:Uncharacterized protein n=1 Tax=Alteromonas phage vB_AmeP_R8W TaxID=2774152 RepID=A0A8E4W6R4_9CAUD|nr:hypothetical protein vBAmePR8F_gp02 [Alteromonas phage vB_AmeP_R8W]
MTLEQELALAALRHEEIRTEVVDGTALLNDLDRPSVVINDTVIEYDEILDDDLDW